MKNLFVYFILGVLVSCGNLSSTKDFTIIEENEVIIENYKTLYISVRLDDKVRENELKKISLKIKKGRRSNENLSILYYLKDEVGENFLWASSTFKPDLIIQIYGDKKGVIKERNVTEKYSFGLDRHVPRINDEKIDSLLIIAGKSLGDIQLGMTKEEVLSIISYTGPVTDDKWRIHTEEYVRFLSIDFNDNTVYQISFTYPEFKTKEGFSLENHRNNPEHFVVYTHKDEFLPQMIDLMYVINSGGLAFIDYDIHDTDPENQDLLYWGIIFEGDFPQDELSQDWIRVGEETESESEGEYDG